jgi:hypothetical protein
VSSHVEVLEGGVLHVVYDRRHEKTREQLIRIDLAAGNGAGGHVHATSDQALALAAILLAHVRGVQP